MEINNDPKVIVMDQEKYDMLQRACCSGVIGREVDQHVRRFNPHYRAAVEAQRKRLEQVRKDKIAAVRAFIRRKLNQTVYVLDYASGTGPARKMYTPGRLLGKADDKEYVRVEFIKWDVRYKTDSRVVREMELSQLVEELPAGYQKLVGGPDKGSYMSRDIEDYPDSTHVRRTPDELRGLAKQIAVRIKTNLEK